MIPDPKNQTAVNLLILICLAGLFASAGTLVFAVDGQGELYQPASLYYTGMYQLRDSDPNLTGSGTTIATVCRSLTYIDDQPQNDYRMNEGHDCLSASNITVATDPNLAIDGEAVSAHATAIGGLLVGSDPNGFHPQLGSFVYEGAAPQADLIVYEFWDFVANFVYTSSDIGADILTISMGEIFSDWWTRGIERMAERDGLVVIAGIGNGSNVFDPVLYPAAGANVIGVGVIDSVSSSSISDSVNIFSLASSEHSSTGPTDDNRCKPDIVAPGNCIAPGQSDISGYDETGDWTSFAAPLVAGTASLLVQKASQEPGLNMAVSNDAGNCVIKAILLNSASKLPYWHKGQITTEDDHTAVLDYVQGAGALNTVAAYQHLIAGMQTGGDVDNIGWDNHVIAEDADHGKAYRLNVSDPAGKFITATLNWNRHYENSYPFDAIKDADTDLRLELWAVDPDDPKRNYLLDYSDSQYDNVEHIYCPVDPNYTVYEIVVASADETNASGERYGLAWQVAEGTGKDSLWWYDMNNDGKLDVKDVTALFEKIGTEGEILGDIDMDGKISIEDMKIMLKKIKATITP
jgi:hypothetical protein